MSWIGRLIADLKVLLKKVMVTFHLENVAHWPKE